MLRLTRSSLSLSIILFALLRPAQVSAQDVISVTPQSFTLQANAGTNVPTQTATVRKLKTGIARWSVVPPDKPWLSVTPTSGQNTGTLSLSFQTQTLPAGSDQTSFRVVSGTTSILVTVQLTMIAAAPPPPPTLVVGPQSSITCPMGAADIWPAQSIQLAVDSNPGGTTFCLRAGVYSVDQLNQAEDGQHLCRRIRRDPRRHRLDDGR